MKIINIIGKLPSKATNGTMVKAQIDTIVIHHDAIDRPLFYNSLKRLVQEAKHHIAKGWGHISYHYSIDNIGDVYQCLPETEVAYHCGNLSINKKSIAIKLDGNFDKQSPTTKQITALKQLVDYLCYNRPDLPKVTRKSIKAHKEIKPTACPGKNLYPTVVRLK